jgi:hypothetical protein
MVSWIPVSNASFSLVPTPSVPATRYESPVCENFNKHNNKTKYINKHSDKRTAHYTIPQVPTRIGLA